MKLSRQADSLIEWAGAAAILAGFVGVTAGLVEAQSWQYFSVNAAGSLALGYGAFTKKDMPPVALNVVWLAVALAGLYKVLNG